MKFTDQYNEMAGAVPKGPPRKEFTDKTLKSYIFNNDNVLKGDRDDNMFYNNLKRLDKTLVQLSNKPEFKKMIKDALRSEKLYYPSDELKQIIGK